MNLSKKFSALALALTAAASAHAADSVSIYGIIDAGVRAANNQATPTATAARPGSGMRLSGVSGGLTTSRLGFKGSEDLGGGLKAVFQLEAGLSINNGFAESAFFNRTAHVGLVTEHNAIYLGHDYSELFVSLYEVDPLAMRATPLNPNVFAGGLYDTAAFGNPSTGQVDARVNSAVSYEGNYGALKGGAQYSFGGVAGSNSGASSFGGRLAYQWGPTLLAGSASRLNDAAGSHLSAYSLGAKWSYSEQLSASATYVHQAAYGGAQNGFSRRVGSIGAYYAPGPMSYGLAYYGTRANSIGGAPGVDGSQDKLLGLASYSFSKRTSVYGTVDYSRNRYALVPTTTNQPNGAGVTLGVSHSF